MQFITLFLAFRKQSHKKFSVSIKMPKKSSHFIPYRSRAQNAVLLVCRIRFPAIIFCSLCALGKENKGRLVNRAASARRLKYIGCCLLAALREFTEGEWVIRLNSAAHLRRRGMTRFLVIPRSRAVNNMGCVHSSFLFRSLNRISMLRHIVESV